VIVKCLHEYCRAVEVVGCRETVLYPVFSFDIRSYQSFQSVQKTISDQNRVCKAQGQTQKRVGIYRPSPVFPKARAIWRSADPTYVNIPVADIVGRRHRIGNDKFITLDFLYCNGFKAAVIKINLYLLHILLFLHANYFQVYNWLMYKSFSNKYVQISCVIVIGMVLWYSFYI